MFQPASFGRLLLQNTGTSSLFNVKTNQSSLPNYITKTLADKQDGFPCKT